ncbi:MAG: AAA family ATPase [Desulfobulbaceae bacterium]|nr:AAA family ATPase [Desulfobulbaceae bacterium]
MTQNQLAYNSGVQLNHSGVGQNYVSWTSKFNLSKNPFKDTLDTDLFFRTRQHEEALVKIRIGIEDQHALLLLAGASGTGKTIVSQVVLKALDPAFFEPVFVFVHPGMGKGALLTAILRELGVEKIARYASKQLQQLQEKALTLHANGKRLVVVIDEAHFLKADALHILRTLSNLETESEKLVTVLLVAEDILRRRLNSPYYASLRSRIMFSMRLLNLTFEETEQYIKYRLLKCKAPAHLIEEDSYHVIHHFSKGVPREINRLLYNAFMETIAADRFSISPEILRNVSHKFAFFHGKN